jgi:hypothetical protein
MGIKSIYILYVDTIFRKDKNSVWYISFIFKPVLTRASQRQSLKYIYSYIRTHARTHIHVFRLDYIMKDPVLTVGILHS